MDGCHLALVFGEDKGLAEDMGVEVEALVHKNPQKTGCRLMVTQPTARSSPGEVPTEPGEPDSAGDPACLAHLVCPSCGGVTTEGHQPGCELLVPEAQAASNPLALEKAPDGARTAGAAPA